MGLSKAIVAIKGNQLNQINKISEILNYFEDENLSDEISQTTEFKNGWTILQDEEMVFVSEEDLLQELSEELDTEVFSLTIQSTAATYGFSHFNNGNSRIILVQDGDILENSGESIIQEKDLNIDENISESEISKIAEKLGIDVE
ncbi:hypothetical protein [Flavobacterium sp. HTF]|uniref:hypothetical protein n=1 Tax=Flavobacterium sp. HTF TaxID=2170732 RepID=UPI000D5E173F|nr:hypothetical protein [Flavobacterium sp. HTF]PWB18321.1 hypothetical protein DCO46_22455 [Flavobacterium sp. HTF]